MHFGMFHSMGMSEWVVDGCILKRRDGCILKRLDGCINIIVGMGGSLFL